jgi:pimeloyl-ACP methyl ester carboxylesterase
VGDGTVRALATPVLAAMDELGIGGAHLVGHSLGGAVALHYTAIYPERVSKLVAIEGLGPPPSMLEALRDKPRWERTDAWIRQVRDFAGRLPRRYPSIDAAAARMLEENPFLSPEQARHLTVHGVARNEDGTYGWKFDNYVRVWFPERYDMQEARAAWGRISCPTLLVRGEESWAGDPVKDGRITAFRDARLVNVPNAGHWVHHDQLDVFLRALEAFLENA